MGEWADRALRRTRCGADDAGGATPTAQGVDDRRSAWPQWRARLDRHAHLCFLATSAESPTLGEGIRWQGCVSSHIPHLQTGPLGIYLLASIAPDSMPQRDGRPVRPATGRTATVVDPPPLPRRLLRGRACAFLAPEALQKRKDRGAVSRYCRKLLTTLRNVGFVEGTRYLLKGEVYRVLQVLPGGWLLVRGEDFGREIAVALDELCSAWGRGELRFAVRGSDSREAPSRLPATSHGIIDLGSLPPKQRDEAWRRAPSAPIPNESGELPDPWGSGPMTTGTPASYTAPRCHPDARAARTAD